MPSLICLRRQMLSPQRRRRVGMKLAYSDITLRTRHMIVPSTASIFIKQIRGSRSYFYVSISHSDWLPSIDHRYCCPALRRRFGEEWQQMLKPPGRLMGRSNLYLSRRQLLGFAQSRLKKFGKSWTDNPTYHSRWCYRTCYNITGTWGLFSICQNAYILKLSLEYSSEAFSSKLSYWRKLYTSLLPNPTLLHTRKTTGTPLGVLLCCGKLSVRSFISCPKDK